MLQIKDGDTIITVDVDATRTLYADINRGETEGCDCDKCVYFAAHRGEAYPDSFRQLLERLGIDWQKENETWSAPVPGRTLFVGNFDFIGSVARVESAPSAHAVGEFHYGFKNEAGYPWTQKRADELGLAPVASVSFNAYFAVVFE